MSLKHSMPLWLLLVLAVNYSTSWAAPIGFIERYALAEDRAAVLQSLIPGSEEHFFYHCLHYQVTGDVARAEAILADWERAVTVQRTLAETPALVAIRDRQRLLTYGASPERTIEYLRIRLGVQLNHAPPPMAGERQFPVALDQDTLRVDRLIEESLRNNQPLTPVGLARLADRFLAGEGENLPVDLTWLAERIDGPWYPRLGELVRAELRGRARPQDRQFGDRASHSFLTLGELRGVAEEFPDLAASDAMVNEILARLRPDDDSSAAQQPDVRLAYLIRVDQYTQTLPESRNSLKAASLYRLLEAYLERGEFKKDLFLRYLHLPRQSPIIYRGRDFQPSGFAADLNQDYSGIALLPPIHDEQPLVRAYLEHFLRDAESTADFDGLVNTDYLRRVFAETKLLYGVGEANRWYAMLNPAERQQLTERVELTLAPTNPRIGDAGTPASLAVDLKHVDELIIRVYEINTRAYYRTHEERIDTDIDLDGLVATSEQRLEYKLGDVRRHREQIELPSIEGRGVWVVDLIGGGLRARAILRRGDLRFIEQMTVDGHSFTVLDESRDLVKDARIILAGQEFLADDRGRIVIPPVDTAVTRTAILTDDQIAVPVSFLHRSEDYRLVARMLVNRQQLVGGQTADLVIRPRLTLFDIPVDPSMLKQTTVTITAVDHDGIQTTRRFDDVALTDRQETVLRFRVPSRTSSLTATVQGRIDALATGRSVTVNDSRNWDINGIDRTVQVYDLHLTRSGDDWVVEARGLSGEPVVGAGVRVSLQTIYRQMPVEATLETDENGRVVLGPLEGVEQVVLSSGEGARQMRTLRLSNAVWPSRLHATSDETVRLPLIDPDRTEPTDYRLLALRAGEAAEDVTAAALEIEAGLIHIGPLAAGDYALWDRRDGSYQPTSIAVTAGPEVLDVAAGQVRNLELNWPAPVSVAELAMEDDSLVIRLGGDRSMARVHLLGSRYLAPLDSLAMGLNLPGSRGIQLPENGYVSDLKLGDEIRYVLRRQYADKYPGVMLPQPSLLVAPWVTDVTNNDRQLAEEGEAIPAMATPEAAPAPSELFDRLAEQQREGETSQNLAFLPDGSVVLSNLTPDAEGLIRVPLEQLGDAVLVRVLVVDPVSTIERTAVRPLPPLEPRDLRLAAALPAAKPFTLQRSVLVAGPDRPLEMSTIGAAQVQLYSSVAELLQLYRTLAGDPRMDEFVELGRWQTLNAEAKRALYGRLACHEVHIFLKAKDAEFFDSVVRPYLENKKEKKLVDAWLLDRDLTPWTEIWQYSRLNAFEKALLARAVPGMREAVVREFRERIALNPPDHAALRRLIDAGLAGKAMESDDFGTANRWFFDSNANGQDGVSPAILGGAFGNGAASAGSGGAMGWAAPPMSAAADEASDMLGEALRDKAESRLGRRAGAARGRGLGLEYKKLQVFQQLDATKQWADNHWDQVRVAAANEALIPVDPFWLAWAEANGAEANGAEANGAEAEGDVEFFTEHLLRPTSNRHAALVALALLDLPLEAQSIEMPTEPDAVFTPPQSVAVITKRLRPLEPMEGDASLLVGQRFEAADAPAPDPNDTSEVKIAPDEFLTGQAYVGQIVLTNPTPQPRIVDILWQIPGGALPIGNSQMTDSKTVRIEPFEVQRIEYRFYFPHAGEFVHYPVCISSEGRVVARGLERTFTVVDSPTQIDEESWEQIARNGTAEKIRQYLSNANLRRLNWSLVAHRMRDRNVYDVVLSVLEQARLWQPELWAYAMLYRDQPRLSTYLENREDLVASVGPVLDSPILEVRPIPRAMYEHLEYAPLVRARIHPLHEEPEILNDRFLEQYRSLMRILAFQREARPEQDLALCYYLLLQNRISEALPRFARVEPADVEMQLQYDYMSAVLALHRADYETAGAIAERHVSHPVPRWRQRFAELATQLRQRRDLASGARLVNEQSDEETIDELNGGIREDAADLAIMDRERRQAEGAASTPDVRMRVEGDRLVIDHRNAEQATLRFYGVDLELLFSKTPFVRSGLDRMAMVRPGRVEVIALGTGDGTAEYRLDDGLARQTLLVEVVSGAARDTALYYGGRLKTYVSEGFGQLQVSDRTSGDPVSTAYVKVYSRMQDGQIQFYKDGYTDLRGRFDYATLSSGELDSVASFAILVLDAERGATLHEVAPPTR